MKNNIIIYTLTCPLDNKIKYIGATRESVGIKKRLIQHTGDRNSRINRKNNWIKKLFKLNKRAIIEEINIIPFDEWEFWESYYITLFKSWNFNLYNIAPGGENPPVLSGILNPNYGNRLKQETKDKISKTLKGNVVSEEIRKRISQSMKGRVKSEETRKKLSKSHKGKIISIEHREKMGKKIIGVNIISGEELEFNTIASATRYFSLKSGSGISNCLNMRAKTCNGFTWRYI